MACPPGGPAATAPLAASSGSDDDVVVALPQQRFGQRATKAKRTYGELLGQDGPLTLAVLVGQPRGRWWREFQASAKPCAAARASVERAVGADAGHRQDTAVIAGVAVMRGWRCVRREASHADTFALMAASAAFYSKRTGQAYLEHEVVASASVSDAMNAMASEGQLVEAGPALIERLREAKATVIVTKGQARGQTMPAEHFLAQLRSTYQLTSRVVAWPVAFPLAIAMAKGAWFGDVSVRHRRRVATEDSLAAPVGPSVGLLRYWLQSEEVCMPRAPANQDVVSHGQVQVWDSARGATRGYHPAHILDILRAGLHVHNKANVEGTICSSTRLLRSRGAKASLDSTAILDVPHACTQRRNVVRADVASMLAHRAWYKANGPFYRYVAYDASPQRGHEYFATVERLIRREAIVDSVAAGSTPEVTERRLPLCVLGAGRMGVAEKTQAYVHQTWLDYGPAVDDVRRANSDVRQCLSDMGTELAIADVADVVAECLGQPGAARAIACGDVARLFPLALVVPGPQHIIDTATQAGLLAIPWWPAWQRSAKITCQWLRSAGHRGQLQERLRNGNGEASDAEANVKSLDKSCEAFANWRWKTLATVTRDLLRLQSAVVAATSSVSSANELSSRDAGAAASFLASVSDPEFWTRAEALARLVAPLSALSSWIRGCECHEADRLASKAVPLCSWQGCRAKRLASRIAKASADLDKARESFVDNDLAHAATAILGSFAMKTECFRHEPYLVWQVADTV